MKRERQCELIDDSGWRMIAWIDAHSKTGQWFGRWQVVQAWHTLRWWDAANERMVYEP